MTRRTWSAPGTEVGRVAQGPNRRTPKLLWRLGFAVALAVQLIVVYYPKGVGGVEIPGLDKVVHLLIFAAPALAALMVGIRARWALGILAVHAPVSELIQHFGLANREGDVLDVMADLGGVVLGWLAYVVWSRRQP